MIDSGSPGTNLFRTSASGSRRAVVARARAVYLDAGRVSLRRVVSATSKLPRSIARSTIVRGLFAVAEDVDQGHARGLIAKPRLVTADRTDDLDATAVPWTLQAGD
jgi:hypothetical protein